MERKRQRKRRRRRSGRDRGIGEEAKEAEAESGGRVFPSLQMTVLIRCFVPIREGYLYDPLTSLILFLMLGAQYLHAPLVLH